MEDLQEDQKFAQIVRRIDPHSRLLRAWALKGGISAQVTALEIARHDGQTQKLIVRQHGAVDLAHNPQIAADEFRLLHLLHAAGVPAPRPYHLDQSGEVFATPYIVLEYIEGQPEFAPANLPDLLLQLATQLARIHQIDGARPDASFLPQQAQRFAELLRTRPAAVEASSDEGRIRAALEAVWPLPPRNPSVLLHGDFWPGNVLWRDERLVGVIDWEDAALGDPLADLANSRLELLWAFGIEAMQQFTQQYQALAAIDYTNLPYWDLCAALRLARFADWAADASAEQAMRAGHRQFIAQAFEQLAAQGKL
jgi:aminoglycoside phosphotransferase (APT) family kinase protein